MRRSATSEASQQKHYRKVGRSRQIFCLTTCKEATARAAAPHLCPLPEGKDLMRAGQCCLLCSQPDDDADLATGFIVTGSGRANQSCFEMG